MKSHKTYTVAYKRKREKKTNYKKRLKLLLSNKPRLVIRKSNRFIIAQIIDYNKAGDKTLVSASSLELSKLGWKLSKSNIPAAYLVGLLLGKKAKDKKIDQVILDTGFYSLVKGSKIFACLKGVVDAGLDIPHSENVLPSNERIRGEHIKEHLKGSMAKEKSTQFSKLVKENINPDSIPDLFEEIKKKILQG